MPRYSSGDHDEYDEPYYTNETGAYGYTNEQDANRYTNQTGAHRGDYSEMGPAYTDERSQYGRSLVPRDQGSYLPAPVPQRDPVIIRGTGESMGDALIPRRRRPLTMRVVVIMISVCVLGTGLFAASPLAANGSSIMQYGFRAGAGAVALRGAVNYRYYQVSPGDTPESIAKKFGCQVGGIYELNQLYAGEELQAGAVYKVPIDPTYGADYKAPPLFAGGEAYGTTTYGSSSWTSLAGDPPPEVPCGPDGHGSPLGYQLQSPNKGSHWVRGFTWFHNGVDIAAPGGNQITAAQAGEVIWAGYYSDGFGWSVKINHCNHVSTFYGHMEQLLVKVHDRVNPGDPVGLEGSTGWSTGPHLHYMVEWNNVPVDPMPYYGGQTTAGIAKITGATP